MEKYENYDGEHQGTQKQRKKPEGDNTRKSTNCPDDNGNIVPR